MSHTLSYEYYKVRNWGGFIFSNGYAHSISYIFTLSRNSVNAPIYPREGSDISFSVQLTPPCFTPFVFSQHKNFLSRCVVVL